MRKLFLVMLSIFALLFLGPELLDIWLDYQKGESITTGSIIFLVFAILFLFIAFRHVIKGGRVSINKVSIQNDNLSTKIPYNIGMKTRIKKTALFMLVVGLIVVAISAYFALKQYSLIQNGELVQGGVSQIISISSDDGTTYKPEVTYNWQGTQQVYVPSYSSSINNRRVGDTVQLRVSERGVTLDGFHTGWTGMIIGFVLGLIFFIIGLLWFLRHIQRYDRAVKLKRYGRRVNARFIRKDVTNYKVNNQAGNILYLQEEGSDRVFQTHPIFSEFSIKWLEEHLFDVYVDTANPDEYYVDIEKHFGEPQSHTYE